MLVFCEECCKGRRRRRGSGWYKQWLCVSRVLTVLGPCQRPEEAFREEAVVVLPVGSSRHYICSKHSPRLQLPPEPSPSAAKGKAAPAAEPMCYKTRAKNICLKSTAAIPPKTTWVAEGLWQCTYSPHLGVTKRLVPPLGTPQEDHTVIWGLAGLRKDIPLPEPPSHWTMLIPNTPPRIYFNGEEAGASSKMAISFTSFSNNDLQQQLTSLLFSPAQSTFALPPPTLPFQICSCFSSICEGAQDRSSLNTFPYACGATAYSVQISPFRNEGEFNSVLEWQQEDLSPQ